MNTRMTRRKFIHAVGFAGLATLAACAPQTRTAAPGATTAPQPAATAMPATELVLMGFGSDPIDFPLVLGEVNKKLATDGLGISIKYQFTPSTNDYANLLLLKASAGEVFDGFLNAPWLNMDKMIADQAILVLDDLVAGQTNLLREIPKPMWDANRFNGKIYGIPLGVTQGWFDGFWIRQDLREKYGLAKPKTLKDIEAFFYAVKKNDAQVHPFPFSTVQDFEFFGSIYTAQPQPVISPWGGSPVLVGNLTDHAKALPVWGSPDWLPTAKLLRKWNVDGIIESNVMTLKYADQLPLFLQGQYASLRMDSTGQNTKTVKPLFKNVPTAKLEAVYPYEMSSPKPWSDFKQWNFLCISKTSKSPTKVIALMDWLSIRDNHDLISYGIVGKHWTPVGDTAMTLPEGQTYNFPTYELSMRPGLERLLADTDPVDKQWYDYARDANHFTPSPLIGFTWNEQPVKTELAAVAGVASEYAPGFAGGVYDVDSTVPKMQDAYKNAGYDKVIAEFQSQIDKFLADKANK